MKITKKNSFSTLSSKTTRSVILMAFVGLLVVMGSMASLLEAAERRTINERHLERYDAFGNPIGRKRARVDYEVTTHSELGGVSYIYRHRVSVIARGILVLLIHWDSNITLL